MKLTEKDWDYAKEMVARTSNKLILSVGSTTFTKGAMLNQLDKRTCFGKQIVEIHKKYKHWIDKGGSIDYVSSKED